MTAPRQWPNQAKEIRDQSAEEAQQIIRLLTPVVTNTRAMTETERLRREAVSLNSANRIARMLLMAGAQIREF